MDISVDSLMKVCHAGEVEEVKALLAEVRRKFDKQGLQNEAELMTEKLSYYEDLNLLDFPDHRSQILVP